MKDCRHGRMMYNVNDLYVGKSLDLYGEFSEGETELFEQIVKPGDFVVEVGANIGAHTVWLAKKVAPGGLIVAFEPQRLVFQMLCGNIALNSHINVVCLQNAAGDAPGHVVVPLLDPNKSNNFGGLSLGDFSSGERVAVMRLDDLGLPKCSLVKVDVEGMELNVLKGARQVIERFQPIMYIENDRPDRSDALVKFVNEMKYDAWWHRPPLFNERNFFGNSDNVFGDTASINMICLPKGRPVNVKGLQRVAVPT